MSNENKAEKVERLRKKLEVSSVERLRENIVTYNPENNEDRYRNSSWGLTKYVVIPLLILVVVCGIYTIIEGEKESKNQKAAEQEAISKLVKKHNAITDWNSNLEQLDDVFVVDVQEALINKDSRPFHLSVEVTDIVKAEDKAIVHFREINSDDPDVYFILECNLEQIKTITEHRNEFTEFTVIASIVSVRRANKEDIREEADAGDTFIATGRCLDLQYFNFHTSGGFVIFLSILCVAFIILLTILLNMLMSN